MPIPYSIDLGFRIYEEKLWALNLPVENIDLDDIAYNMDIPYLESIGTDDWNMSPRMLIQNFEKETHHATVVKKADLSYPIHLYFFRGKWIIIDGVHRYTKAMMQGDRYINICKVSEGDIEKVKKSDEDFRKWKGEL